MSNENESCPLCGALPVDWVDDPHPKASAAADRAHKAKMIIAALADLATGDTERTVFGRDLAEWRHRGREWLLEDQ